MPYRWNPLSTRFDRVQDESGEVNGPTPASSTDNAFVRWDGASGRLVQDSVVICDDVGVVTGMTQLTVDNLQLDGNTLSSQDANGNIEFTPNGSGSLVFTPLTGIVVSNGASGTVARSLQQPASGITISNANGVSGNPSFALSDDLAALEAMSGTGLVARIAAQTYAQRQLVQPSSGIVISNSDGVASNPIFSLSDDLNALENLSGTGIAVRTAANTWTNRSIAVTASTGISVNNGDGVSGNPTLAGIDADTTTKGVVELATTAEVTTGTDAARVPSVASMIGHEGIIKAWAKFAMNGTFSDGFNISSVTDTGVGQATVNFTTAFATANFVAVHNAKDGGSGIMSLVDTQTTSSVLLEYRSNTLGALQDPADGAMMIAIGDR